MVLRIRFLVAILCWQFAANASGNTSMNWDEQQRMIDLDDQISQFEMLDGNTTDFLLDQVFAQEESATQSNSTNFRRSRSLESSSKWRTMKLVVEGSTQAYRRQDNILRRVPEDGVVAFGQGDLLVGGSCESETTCGVFDNNRMFRRSNPNVPIGVSFQACTTPSIVAKSINQWTCTWNLVFSISSTRVPRSHSSESAGLDGSTDVCCGLGLSFENPTYCSAKKCNAPKQGGILGLLYAEIACCPKKQQVRRDGSS